MYKNVIELFDEATGFEAQQATFRTIDGKLTLSISAIVNRKLFTFNFTSSDIEDFQARAIEHFIKLAEKML